MEDRGQPGCEKLRIHEAVETDEREIVGHRETNPLECAKRAQSQQAARRDYRCRALAIAQEPLDLLGVVAEPSGSPKDRFLVDAQVGRFEGVSERLGPLVDRPDIEVTGYERDAGMTKDMR